MNDLQCSAFVELPLQDAPEYIDRFFVKFSKLPDSVRLGIRSQVHLPALDTQIELRHEVIVTLSIRRPATVADEAEYLVAWEPADGGAFPRLRGSLRIQSVDEAGGFVLILGGCYEAPSGGAVHLCDIATGHRIAQATARDLLSYIVRALERAYRADVGLVAEVRPVEVRPEKEVREGTLARRDRRNDLAKR